MSAAPDVNKNRTSFFHPYIFLRVAAAEQTYRNLSRTYVPFSTKYVR